MTNRKWEDIREEFRFGRLHFMSHEWCGNSPSIHPEGPSNDTDKGRTKILWATLASNDASQQSLLLCSVDGLESVCFDDIMEHSVHLNRLNIYRSTTNEGVALLSRPQYRIVQPKFSLNIGCCALLILAGIQHQHHTSTPFHSLTVFSSIILIAIHYIVLNWFVH